MRLFGKGKETGRFTSRSERSYILQLVEDQVPISEIALETGRTRETIYKVIERDRTEREAKAKKVVDEEEAWRKKHPMEAIIRDLKMTALAGVAQDLESNPEAARELQDGIRKQMLKELGVGPHDVPTDSTIGAILGNVSKAAVNLFGNPQGQQTGIALLQQLMDPAHKAAAATITQLAAENAALKHHIQSQQPDQQSQLTEEPPADRPPLRLVQNEDEEEQPMNLADLSPNDVLKRWMGLEPAVAAAECRLYSQAHPEFGDLPGMLQMSALEFIQTPFGQQLDKMLLIPLGTDEGAAWLGALKAALAQPEPTTAETGAM